MRLIDADELLKQINIWCDCVDGACLLKDAPTVQAVPLDKVKQAREEFISKYPKNYMGEPELGGRTCYFSLNDVLAILDKLIVESEEK